MDYVAERAKLEATIKHNQQLMRDAYLSCPDLAQQYIRAYLKCLTEEGQFQKVINDPNFATEEVRSDLVSMWTRHHFIFEQIRQQRGVGNMAVNYRLLLRVFYGGFSVPLFDHPVYGSSEGCFWNYRTKWIGPREFAWRKVRDSPDLLNAIQRCEQAYTPLCHNVNVAKRRLKAIELMEVLENHTPLCGDVIRSIVDEWL